MAARDFRELRVYQAAFKAAMDIFELSKMFPKDEQYSLTDQIRRSSRSVCANIAEAWRKRQYVAVFANKLSDADMEAAETIVWISFAHGCNYWNMEVSSRLNDCYEQICKQLTIMIKDAPQWKPDINHEK